MPTSVRWAAPVLSAALLMAVAVWIYGPVFEIPPLYGDNFYVLTWAHTTPASGVWSVDPGIYPEWRPLPYATVWLQYRWWGVDTMAPYFLLNLVLWAACAGLVSAIVERVTDSWSAAVVGGLMVLVDERAVSTMTWIVDRQGSMSCLFGLLAVWLLVSRRDRPPTARESGALLVLLVASALSKEYGLAFAFALALHGVLVHQRATAAAAAGAVAIYAALRLTTVSGATARYCEDMGYFWNTSRVCIDQLTSAAPQMAYNVVASAIGSVLKGVFDFYGALAIDPRWLLMSAPGLVLAAVALKRGRPVTRTLLAVLLLNAVLSALLYRSRNQVVALTAYGVLVGIGFAHAQVGLRSLGGRTAQVVMAVLIGALLFVQQDYTRRVTAGIVLEMQDGDVCGELSGEADQSERNAIDRISIRYGTGKPCPDPTGGS